jgi:hypothetical protein
MFRTPHEGRFRAAASSRRFAARRAGHGIPAPQAGIKRSPEAGIKRAPEAGIKRSPEAGIKRSPEAGIKRSPEAGGRFPAPSAGNNIPAVVA